MTFRILRRTDTTSGRWDSPSRMSISVGRSGAFLRARPLETRAWNRFNEAHLQVKFAEEVFFWALQSPLPQLVFTSVSVSGNKTEYFLPYQLYFQAFIMQGLWWKVVVMLM